MIIIFTEFVMRRKLDVSRITQYILKRHKTQFLTRIHTKIYMNLLLSDLYDVDVYIIIITVSDLCS
jgi:hypothetical protein